MFEKQFEKIKNKLKKNLVKGGYVLNNEMKNIVAIDTGHLMSEIKTFPLEENGNILKVSVGTENVSYAKYIEGKAGKTIKQYHRRSGASRPVVWVGVGMQYMARSLENKKEEIKSLIKS